MRRTLSPFRARSSSSSPTRVHKGKVVVARTPGTPTISLNISTHTHSEKDLPLVSRCHSIAPNNRPLDEGPARIYVLFSSHSHPFSAGANVGAYAAITAVLFLGSALPAVEPDRLISQSNKPSLWGGEELDGGNDTGSGATDGPLPSPTCIYHSTSNEDSYGTDEWMGEREGYRVSTWGPSTAVRLHFSVNESRREYVFLISCWRSQPFGAFNNTVNIRRAEGREEMGKMKNYGRLIDGRNKMRERQLIW